MLFPEGNLFIFFFKEWSVLFANLRRSLEKIILANFDTAFNSDLQPSISNGFGIGNESATPETMSKPGIDCGLPETAATMV